MSDAHPYTRTVQAAAFFDLDRTLIRRSSVRPAVSPAALAAIPLLLGAATAVWAARRHAA